MIFTAFLWLLQRISLVLYPLTQLFLLREKAFYSQKGLPFDFIVLEGSVINTNFVTSFITVNLYPEKLSLVLHFLPETKWAPSLFPTLEFHD